MQSTKTYQPLVVAVLLLMLGVWLVYPYCRCYIDPDATACLTIAQRYAHADWHRAINAYWSPWACWLSAALISALQLNAFLAALLVNAFAALGFLFVSYRLFLFFSLRNIWLWAMLLSLAVFLVYAVYWQLFNDLYCAFFLLLVLYLQLQINYLQSKGLQTITALLAALAYLAKPSALPFFFLSTLLLLFINTPLSTPYRTKKIFGSTAYVMLLMLLFISPWLYVVHAKYGIWSGSTAVLLNSSWSLMGHPIWKAGIHQLLPPVYPNSPSYWEDPFWVNGPAPHFYNSLSLFFTQLIRSAYYSIFLIGAMNQLSAFMLPAYVFSLLLLLSPQLHVRFMPQVRLLAALFILFPIPFLLLRAEARYLWYMLPLGMILLAMAFQHFHKQLKGFWPNAALLFLVSFSFLAFPLYNMSTIINAGKQEEQLAATLIQRGIKGSFTSNASLGTETQSMQRLAYFSGNSYYNMPDINCSTQELLSEMQRYGIHYYFYYAHGADTKAVFTDANGKPYPELGCVGNLHIFRVY
jgi:hypothetical protein